MLANIKAGDVVKRIAIGRYTRTGDSSKQVAQKVNTRSVRVEGILFDKTTGEMLGSPRGPIIFKIAEWTEEDEQRLAQEKRLERLRDCVKTLASFNGDLTDSQIADLEQATRAIQAR